MIAILIISICVYIALTFATIKKMYELQQSRYVVLKIMTSVMFVFIGAISFSLSGDDFFIKCLPAFILCLIGDALLALAHEIDNKLKNPQFVLGVGAFLVAHVFFCVQFLIELQWKIGITSVISLIMVGISVYCVLSPKYEFGNNKVPSVIYSFFVGLLCGLGLQLMIENPTDLKMVLIGAGSFFFLVSDFVLSQKYFKINKGKSWGLIVLVFYYGAMLCLSLANIFG